MGRHIEPAILRARVIDALGHLPPEEHLAVLHAMDHGDFQVDLVDPTTLQVAIGPELSIEIPLAECTVEDEPNRPAS